MWIKSTACRGALLGSCALLLASGCGEEPSAPVTIVEFPESKPIASVSEALSGRQLGVDGEIEVDFVLRDFGGDPAEGGLQAQVTVEFAEAGGEDYSPCTPGEGSLNPMVLEATASGKAYTFKWAASEDLDRSKAVQIRVTPRAEDGGVGVAGSSTGFVALNDAPSLSDPEVSILGAGLLRVAFKLSDSTEDPTSVLMQVVDGDNPRDVILSEPTLIEGLPTALRTARAGASHAIVWSLKADVESVEDAFQIALTPTDALGAVGEQVLLGPFEPIDVSDAGRVKESIVPLSPSSGQVLRAAEGAASLRFVLIGPEASTAAVRLETLIEGVTAPMRIEALIAEDDPGAMDLDLSDLPTSEAGEVYTALWSVGADVPNDINDLSVGFAVSRSSGDAEEFEVLVPVRVDGNHNPTAVLTPPPALVTDPAVDLRVVISDDEGNPVDLSLRVSFDGGESFVDATIDQSTPRRNLPGDGSEQVVRWRVQDDVLGAFGANVAVRHAVLEVVVADGALDELSTSAPLLSAPFAIEVEQPVDPGLSSLQVSRSSALANLQDSLQVTVTARDAAGEPVVGRSVVIDVTGEGNVLTPAIGVTGIDGVFEAALSARRAERKTITARVLSGGGEVRLSDRREVLFQGDPSAASASQSSAASSPQGPLPADGLTSYSVEVTARDTLGNAIEGIGARATTASLGVGIGNAFQQTDAQGRATFLVNSTSTGQVRLEVRLEAEGRAPVTLPPVLLGFGAGEPERLAFLRAPDESVAGEPMAMVVGFVDRFGNPVVGRGEARVTLSIAQGPQGGRLQGPTEVQASAGEALFAVVLAKAGAYQLSASAQGLGSATSSTITVEAGAASRLSFVNQPRDTAVGAANTAQVSVSVSDGFGNAVDDFEAAIRLELGNNISGAGLFGGDPQVATGGVAIFGQLIVDRAGAGYTLLALAEGLEEAESEPFDVGLFLEGPSRLVGPTPVDLASGDMDNDGILDIVVANGNTPGSFGIFLGNGAGGFDSAGSEFLAIRPISVALSHLNGDSNLDVVLMSYDQNLDRATVQVFAGNGQGDTGNVNSKFAGGQPVDMAAGDLDGDGIQDFAVLMADRTVAIFRGTDALLVRDAVIVPVAGLLQPRAIAISDLNADGRGDLVVADDAGVQEGRLWLLDGQGALAFGAPREVRVAAQPSALGVGDLNDDGRLDLISAGAQGVSVLASIGGGQFLSLGTIPAGDGVSDLELVDLDGDGDLDIATSNRVGDDVSIALGDGFGGFDVIAPGQAGNGPSALVSGDFDGDRARDLVVSNRDDNDVTVLLNARP